VKRPALAGSARTLADPDANQLAVMGGGVEQQSLDVTRVGPRAQHIQQPIAAVPVLSELDADRPIGVVELGLLGRREIPIPDNIEIRRGLVEIASSRSRSCGLMHFAWHRPSSRLKR